MVGQGSIREQVIGLANRNATPEDYWRHLTNVLRCLQLEAHGYQVNVTELVGWEHSMKNELIIARYKNRPRRASAERLNELLGMLGLEELRGRFFAD